MQHFKTRRYEDCPTSPPLNVALRLPFNDRFITHVLCNVCENMQNNTIKDTKNLRLNRDDYNR